MAKQKKGVKIMAFLALFGITIGIIGTGVLVLFSGNNTTPSNTQTLSAEDYAKLQEMIESQSGITTESQVEIINNTLTGTIK